MQLNVSFRKFVNISPEVPKVFYKSNQLDATLQVNLLFLVISTCFGLCFRSSSVTLVCIYSIWCYSPRMLSAGVLDELKLNYVVCEACIHVSQTT
jgi:hypothetical protein